MSSVPNVPIGEKKEKKEEGRRKNHLEPTPSPSVSPVINNIPLLSDSNSLVPPVDHQCQQCRDEPQDTVDDSQSPSTLRHHTTLLNTNIPPLTVI